MTATADKGRVPRFNIVAIGGAHQFPHFLPVGFALHSAGTAQVVIFVPTDADAVAVDQLAARMGVAVPPVEIMRLPPFAEALLMRGRGKLHKAARLVWWHRRLRDAEGLLSAERTSTLLKRLPGQCPTFLHIPHGAGDRAVGFEKRLGLFDHVITAGEKDRQRMVADGVVAFDRCHVGGPVKLAALGTAGFGARLFTNERPVILYNPHFMERLGSFTSHAGPLIDAVIADGRYNLVVAPHVRLAQGWSASDIAAWEGRSVPGRVIVDMGSVRSIDMTYTQAANIYLGDVSSQVYEFLVQPRPCAFINAHGVEWRDDPDYAMWNFGPVAGPGDDVIGVIDSAIATHAAHRAVQEVKVAQALSLDNGLASLDGVVEGVAALVVKLIRPSRPSVA